MLCQQSLIRAGTEGAHADAWTCSLSQSANKFRWLRRSSVEFITLYSMATGSAPPFTPEQLAWLQSRLPSTLGASPALQQASSSLLDPQVLGPAVGTASTAPGMLK